MKNDWFAIWCADYEGLIETAIRNLCADLAVGYNPYGESIKRSRAVVDEFKTRYADGLEKLKSLDEKQAGRWCYLDMKKRGAI